MAPRPGPRWNPTASLQRGRARAGAECAGKLGGGLYRDVTSTGPRPRGRGMRSPETPIQRAIGTSTGPRPRGRGMGQFATGTFTAFANFNGAAPARARNAKMLTTGWLLLLPHFNGAAPARARNAARSRSGLTRTPCDFNGAAPARARNVFNFFCNHQIRP